MRPLTRPRIRKLGVVTLTLVFTLAALIGSSTASVAAAGTKAGLGQLLTAHALSDNVRGIATFGSVPTASQVSSLTSLGLKVQPMQQVRLALVAGPVSAMQRAVNSGIASDIYPDERLRYFDTSSSNSIGGASLRKAGWTGKGVTVAVVDSGCDASHPDLADHVAHNVILASGEYVNQHPNGDNTIAVATETGPYQNSDLGSGHGTHVAGIIAADSSSVSDGSRFGVAPNAQLVCFAIGLTLFTSAVVTAYDYLLRQPGLWGVDVINNSWGNVFRQFDPNDPVSVITKAVYDRGVTVVFANGNAGTDEMSMNPYAMAPWVIAVGAGDTSYKIGSFSSTGLQFDNSIPGQIGAGGHSVYTGDRIGLYHPDVVAPGVSISSTCDTAGTVIGPCPPGSNATANGTSMAAPHVAGAAAVLLQANPRLTPTQVRLALQATARQMTDGNGKALPFFVQGYGFIDLAKAVALVRSSGWADKIKNASATANARVLAADGYRVARSDFWTYPAPRVAVAGSDTQTYTVGVPSTTRFLKVAIAHPGLGVLCCNGMSYDVTVTDAAGKVVAQTTELTSNGSAAAFVDLSKVSPKVRYGTFKVTVVGQAAASDPDTFDSDSLLGRMITVQVAQLVAGK